MKLFFGMPLHKDSRLHEFKHLLDISPFYKQKQKSNECTTLQENLSIHFFQII